MLKPLEDRVILKPEKEKEQVTTSGLVIANSMKDDSNIAVVLAVGIGRVLPNGERAEMEVKVGDRVLFDQFAVKPFKNGAEELLVIYTRDILAVIDGED